MARNSRHGWGKVKENHVSSGDQPSETPVGTPLADLIQNIMGRIRGPSEKQNGPPDEGRPLGTELAEKILALKGLLRGHKSDDDGVEPGDDDTGDDTGDGGSEPPQDPPPPDPVPTQTGTPGGDTLTGTGADDYLSGGGGMDYLIGLGGNDRLDGGGGDDILDGGAGADELNGGAGNDLAIYTGSPQGVTVSLASGTGTGGDAEGDTLTGIEFVKGSKFDDVLIGDAADNRLFGDDGDDLLIGGAGADLLVGWYGNDTVDYSGSAGAVSINLETRVNSGGDADGDIISMVENLIGSGLGDVLVGDLLNNELTGGAGNDLLTGNAGADVFVFANSGVGMDGDDTITDFELGVDLIRFESGVFEIATGLTIVQDNTDALVTSIYGTIRLSDVDASLLDDTSFDFAPDPGLMG